jgi:hypothetical protein
MTGQTWFPHYEFTLFRKCKVHTKIGKKAEAGKEIMMPLFKSSSGRHWI